MKTHLTLRTVLGLIVLFFFYQGHGQQVQLRGSVAMHNSKYQTGEVMYVENVRITAPFAQPTFTDVNGFFTLEFVGLDPGQDIKIKAFKQGLEIVNTYDLDQVVIGRRLPLRIYVTQKGNLAKAQTELYKVSQQALFADRDQMIARLRGEKTQSAAAMKELQKRFGQVLKDRFAAEDLLRKKVEEQQQQLAKFAMELAKKNLDNASNLYLRAYELFQEGKISEVIVLLAKAKREEYRNREHLQQIRATIRQEKALLVLQEEEHYFEIQQLIETFNLKADALALEFRYGEVAAAFQEIIDIHLENELPKKDYPRWYTKLGKAFDKNGNDASALRAYQTSLEIQEEMLGVKDSDLSETYNNIGGIHRKMGSYQQSLSFYQKALSIQEVVLSPKDLVLADSYSGTGDTYLDMGRYNEALACYQKTLAIREEALSIKDPLLATSYNNVGIAYARKEDYGKALNFYQKALAIREEVLDARHPDLAISYNNMGVIYVRKGWYGKALSLYQKVLDIENVVLDPKHPHLAITYNNIADTYSLMGRYDASLEVHQKALAIFEEVLDASHPYVAISYFNLARTLMGLQQYKAAEEYLQKAIAIFKEKKHPYLITGYGRIGLLQLKLGNTSKARRYFNLYNELAKEKDKAFGAYYEALYHTVKGNYSKALDLLEEAVAKGYSHRVDSPQEELLEPLHGQPRYEVLVKKLLKEKKLTSRDHQN